MDRTKFEPYPAGARAPESTLMAVGQPHILVLTLHTDEPQLGRCVEVIRAQEDVIVEHQIISGLGNTEAHQALYETVESRASEFDLFVKVDADMVLANAAVLARIGGLFGADPELDHAQLAIEDFYTDHRIMGLHAFSPRVRWPRVDEGLFVDPMPRVPGRRAALWEPSATVAFHSPDPSPLQAFRFGLHRASKAFQPGRKRFRGSQAHEQWQTLGRTWDAFIRHGDLARGLATYGADLIWRGAIALDGEGYQSAKIDCAFDEAPNDPRLLLEALEARWRPSVGRAVRHMRSLGPKRTARMLGASARQQLQFTQGRRK